MNKRNGCYHLGGEEGNRIMVLCEYKLQKKIFDSFQSRDKMCFPSHNSSQGKQFDLVEFSKNLLSICYVVIIYTNMKCFLPSSVLESKAAVRHRTFQYNLTNMRYTIGAIQKALWNNTGSGQQWGCGLGYWKNQETQEEMTPQLSLELRVAK